MKSDHDRVIENLRPNKKYIFRVRGINEFGQPSDWSDALVYKTPGDSSVPGPPTNLVLNFASPDLIIKWDAPSYNSDGTIITDLSHYQITIISSSGGQAVFETSTRLFNFTFDLNEEAFGSPKPELSVSVRAVDITGKKSVPVTGIATNQPPPTPASAPVLVTGFTIINIAMDKNGVADFDHFNLYHSTDDITYDLVELPDGDTNYSHEVTQGSQNFYKYKIVDVFNQESPDYSPTASTTTFAEATILDTDPPTVPTGLAIDDSGFEAAINAWVEASWNASTDDDSAVAYYEVNYKKTSAAVFSKILVGADGTSVRIENLDPNVAHHIKVRAVDIYGNPSAFTALLPFTTDTDTVPPAVPTGVNTTPGIRTIGVSWNPNTESDFSHYELHASKTNGFTPGPTNLVHTGNSTSFVLQDVNWQDTWNFKVRAVDDYDNASAYTAQSSDSSTETYVNDTTAPSTPSGVSLSTNLSQNEQINRSNILIEWLANTEPDLAGYEVGYKDAFDTAWTTYSVPAGTEDFLADNLMPSTSYNIRVAAFDTNLNKSAFHTASITTAGDSVAPNPPGNPSEITVLRSIFFSWDIVAATDLAGYHVQIATDSGFTSIVKEWEGLATAMEYEGASATTYYLRVRAYDRSGNYSTYSSPIPTTTALIEDADDQPPAVPTGLSAVEGQEFNGQTETRYINVSWNAVAESDLAGYNVRLRRGTESRYEYRDVPAGITSVKFNGLNPSDSYKVAVRAYDQFGYASAYTAEATINTTADSTIPPNVTGFTANPFIKATRLTWDAVVIPDLSHYVIHVGETNDFTPTTNNKYIETTATSLTVTKYYNGTWADMLPGVTYFYKIKAVDRSGNESPNFVTTNGTPEPIWVSSGNLIPNSGFESNDLTYVGPIYGAPYIRDSVEIYDGSYSLKVTTDVDTDLEGVDFGTIPSYYLPAGRKLVGSAYVKGPAGEELGITYRHQDHDNPVGFGISSTQRNTYTLTGNWQRIEAQPYKSNINRDIRLDIRQGAGSASVAFDFYVDNVQLEEGETVTAYTPTPAEFTKPASPTNITIQEQGDLLLISFDEVVSEPVDEYQIWAAYGADVDYQIIGSLAPDDIILGTGQLYDQNVIRQGTVYYRVYSVKNSIKSNPLTGSHTVTRTVSEAGMNLKVEAMATSFILTYTIPDDRLLEYITINYEARATDSGFDYINSLEVYRGMTDNFIYEIKTAELDYFHKFWVEAHTRS